MILTIFKYLALLRSSPLEVYHQKETAALSSIRFQFAEKRQADSYVTWIAEHMNWPVPPEFLLSGAQRVWEWDVEEDFGGTETKVREYLNSFRAQEGRIVLMAKGGEHNKLRPNLEWQKEPWYDTEYHVEHLEENFIKQVNEIIESPLQY